MSQRYVKDPQAKLDYSVDWTAGEGGSWLQTGETITASTWTVPAGITQSTPAPSFTGTKTTIWLTGGTVGVNYAVVNHITTNQGREDDRTIHIHVANR